MRHMFRYLLAQPFTKLDDSFLMAGGSEMTVLAGKHQVSGAKKPARGGGARSLDLKHGAGARLREGSAQKPFLAWAKLPDL